MYAPAHSVHSFATAREVITCNKDIDVRDCGMILNGSVFTRPTIWL